MRFDGPDVKLTISSDQQNFADSHESCFTGFNSVANCYAIVVKTMAVNLLKNGIECIMRKMKAKIVRRATSKDMKKSSPVRDVDAYIQAAPREARVKLVQLRKIIKGAAPGADEGISYKMPYYKYHGALVYFAAFKNHVSLFVPSPVIEEHKRELRGYETTKATVHFPLDKPLPVALAKKLINARIAKNEGARKRT